MNLKVQNLTHAEIENDAEELLSEYARARGIVIVPPIPIEDIVENHLKLGLEFDDTHSLFGVPRSRQGACILGAIFFDSRRIVIDDRLDPYENPAREGRFRFTLAHEGGGHWRLHRAQFARESLEASLSNTPALPAVICRQTGKRQASRGMVSRCLCFVSVNAERVGVGGMVGGTWRSRTAQQRREPEISDCKRREIK